MASCWAQAPLKALVCVRVSAPKCHRDVAPGDMKPRNFFSSSSSSYATSRPPYFGSSGSHTHMSNDSRGGGSLGVILSPGSSTFSSSFSHIQNTSWACVRENDDGWILVKREEEREKNQSHLSIGI